MILFVAASPVLEIVNVFMIEYLAFELEPM